MSFKDLLAVGLIGAMGSALSTAAHAQDYRQAISNNMALCDGSSNAVQVNVSEIKNSSGNMRVQLYYGTREDWLERGRWLFRIEIPATEGNMSFCVPTHGPGTYAVAVRHDVNGNGSTDITRDGGAMSNNPSINIFNLGKPSYRKTRFDVGEGLTTINIRMRYL